MTEHVSEISSVNDDDSVISIEQAELAALRFLGRKAGSRALCTGSVAINDGRKPLMYVVNFANNSGFVVLSASKKYEPVLAYSDEGSFCLYPPIESGVNYWLSIMRTALTESLSDSALVANRNKWESLLYQANKPIVGSRAYSSEIEMLHLNAEQEWYENGWTYVPVAQIYDNLVHESMPLEIKQKISQLVESGQICNITGRPAYEDSYVIYRHEYNTSKAQPVIKSKWGQGSPYNAALVTKYPKATYLGCAAVAAGQIIRYHKSTPGYDYSDMPDVANNYTNRVVSEFLLDIGEKLGINYQDGQSGTKVSKVVKYFEYLGYRCKLIKGALSDVASYSVPVLVNGESVNLSNNATNYHMWICDGFTVNQYKTTYNLMIPNENYTDAGNMWYVPYSYNFNGYCDEGRNVFVHCNWGWKGNSDGYFQLANPQSYNFTDLQIITLEQ